MTFNSSAFSAVIDALSFTADLAHSIFRGACGNAWLPWRRDYDGARIRFLAAFSTRGVEADDD